MANYGKVRGAGESVSAPKTQDFKKHKPVLPAERKLKYSK